LSLLCFDSLRRDQPVQFGPALGGGQFRLQVADWLHPLDLAVLAARVDGGAVLRLLDALGGAMGFRLLLA